MRISAGIGDYSTKTAARGTGMRGGRYSNAGSDTGRTTDANQAAVAGSLLWQMTEGESEQKKQTSLTGGEEAGGETVTDRSEAVKVYEEAFKGGENPIKNLLSAPKVPYGSLAKDGVIVYNGVLFTCDERSNSICLGDVSDPKQVINITLSGGGHLKVNRNCLDQLGRAIGMFSPEDVNLIMRAIHQDTKVQSMQKEIEDLEAGVGEQIASGNGAAENDTTENDAVSDNTAEPDKKEPEE